jgi:hypothetical protein
MANKNSQQPEISPSKKLLFRVIFFVLILLFMEFLLSFAGLEKYDSKFMPKSSYRIFIPGKGDMSDYYVTSPIRIITWGSYVTGYRCCMHELHGMTGKAGAIVKDIDHGGAVIGRNPVDNCLVYPASSNFSGIIIARSFVCSAELIGIDGQTFGPLIGCA